MNIDEQLKALLTEIQKPANENLTQIVEIKKKLIEAQNFEEAIVLNKIERSLLDFISIADPITKHSRTTRIKEIFEKKTYPQMNTKKVTQEDNDSLEIQLVKEFGKDCTLDGILNLETYNATSPKILWILKEGNYGKEYLGNTDSEEEYSSEEFEKEFIRIKSIKEKYYNDVTQYPRWRFTFENICYISCGIIENVWKFDDISNIEPDATIDGKYYLNNIAFINVKKAPGGNKSDKNLISEGYLRHKDFILTQIETINPDIIFNCSGVSELRNDLKGGNIIDDELNCVINNGRLIINAYHPGAPKYDNSNEPYVDFNLKIVKDYLTK